MSNPPPSPAGSVSSNTFSGVKTPPLSVAASVTSAVSEKSNVASVVSEKSNAASVVKTMSNISTKSDARIEKTPSVKSLSVQSEKSEKPIASPPASARKAPKKIGKKSPFSRQGGPAYPEGSWLNENGYEASTAYQEMNGKVAIPQMATAKLKMKNVTKGVPSPPPPYQPGIPKALIGNIEHQDYPVQIQEEDYRHQSHDYNETHQVEDYSVCNICNLRIAGAPFCSATGKRHGISDVSQPCYVVPQTIPIQRGAVATIPIPKTNDPEVEFTLEAPPACLPEDRVPFTLTELLHESAAAPSTVRQSSIVSRQPSVSRSGPQFYSTGAASMLGGPQWDRIEQLSDRYIENLGSPNTTHIAAHVRNLDEPPNSPVSVVSSFPSPGRVAIHVREGSVHKDLTSLRTPNGSPPCALSAVRSVSPRRNHASPSLLVKMQAKYPQNDFLSTNANFPVSPQSPRSDRKAYL